MAAKKRKKPAVCTKYVMRERESGKWLTWGDGTTGSFDCAILFNRRPEREDDFEIVPVRCRALTSKAKNPKRTR